MERCLKHLGGGITIWESNRKNNNKQQTKYEKNLGIAALASFIAAQPLLACQVLTYGACFSGSDGQCINDGNGGSYKLSGSHALTYPNGNEFAISGWDDFTVFAKSSMSVDCVTASEAWVWNNTTCSGAYIGHILASITIKNTVSDYTTPVDTLGLGPICNGG